MKNEIKYLFDGERAAPFVRNNQLHYRTQSEPNTVHKTLTGFPPIQLPAFHALRGIADGLFFQLGTCCWEGELSLHFSKETVGISGHIKYFQRGDFGTLRMLVGQMIGCLTMLRKGSQGPFEISYWVSQQCELSSPE